MAKALDDLATECGLPPGGTGASLGVWFDADGCGTHVIAKASEGRSLDAVSSCVANRLAGERWSCAVGHACITVSHALL